MKTKQLIKDAGRQLFNERGLLNVTLRDIAEELNRSYGNVTYHYGNKEVLISVLFEDMNEELARLQQPSVDTDLLNYFLALPELSFDITLKYLFFVIDYNDIKRRYPDFFSCVSELNEARKVKWLQLLTMLVEQGYFKRDLIREDLRYIMFLSGSVRTSYFQLTEKAHYDRQQYVQAVNMLLRPYLSIKGMMVFKQMF